MGARWVLLAFGILYALMAVVISPAHGWIWPVDDLIWKVLVLVTIVLLTVVRHPAQWLADALGVPGLGVAMGMILVVCLVFAAMAIARLARRDGRGKGLATFVLLLAISVPPGVVWTWNEIDSIGR